MHKVLLERTNWKTNIPIRKHLTRYSTVYQRYIAQLVYNCSKIEKITKQFIHLLLLSFCWATGSGVQTTTDRSLDPGGGLCPASPAPLPAAACSLRAAGVLLVPDSCVCWLLVGGAPGSVCCSLLVPALWARLLSVTLSVDCKLKINYNIHNSVILRTAFI